MLPETRGVVDVCIGHGKARVVAGCYFFVERHHTDGRSYLYIRQSAAFCVLSDSLLGRRNIAGGLDVAIPQGQLFLLPLPQSQHRDRRTAELSLWPRWSDGEQSTAFMDRAVNIQAQGRCPAMPRLLVQHNPDGHCSPSSPPPLLDGRCNPRHDVFQPRCPPDFLPAAGNGVSSPLSR
jgi:hypothetical protein